MSNDRNTPLEILESIAKSTSNSSLKAKLEELRKTKVNILLVGGTGVGKSSTVNALFDLQLEESCAKVGTGHNPETKEISSYELKNVVLWDTPGLGDSEEEDKRFISMLTDKLREKDHNGDALIDLILLVVDSTNRDLGTTYKVLRETIIPNLQPNEEGQLDRLIIALNKIDNVEGGDLWDREKNEPTQELLDYMDQKVESVKKRIEEDSGFKCEPIYYSAGNKLRNKSPYNISKLFRVLISHIQTKKRAVIFEDRNKNKDIFEKNDGKENYNAEAEKSVWDSVKEVLSSYTKEFINYLGTDDGRETIKKVLGTAFVFVQKYFSSKK